MKSSTIALTQPQCKTAGYSWLDKIAKKIFFSKFENIKHGTITLHDGLDKYILGKNDSAFSLNANVIIYNSNFYSDVVFGGTLGAGESYMAKAWDCEELTDLIRIILKNEDLLHAIDGGLGKLIMPLHKTFHHLHRNSVKGSRRNIEAHYDLGNDMFEQFLDSTMMYSSGIFEQTNMTMEQASIAKLDRICKKLQLNSSTSVLEIGTGWGEFAVYAAKNYGCHVTTTTISKQQHDYTMKKIQRYGLEEKITLLCEDYRKLNGKFDRIVSIEMIEAVGYPYYKTYFSHCNNLLKSDGMMLLQSITIADQRYKAAKNEVDFIQRYIFPGGCLPSVNVLAETVNKHTDMRFFQMEDIGPHYAITLKKWRERFFENIESIKTLGYSETFIRMWNFYLCYCEGGFRERGIGTIQLLLTKPLARRIPCISPASTLQ